MPSVKFDLCIATRDDETALRENWRLSFGDTDDYLDFFFGRRFVPEETLVAAVGGRVVSQLFLLPVPLRTQAGMLSADYLFAAATRPDHRGMGIMSALMHEARLFCEKRKRDAVVLMPGTRQLYSFYAKLGFETAFSRRTWNVDRATLASLSVPVHDATDVRSVLNRILAGRDGLCWDADALDYALEEHRAFRGTYATSEHAFVAVDDDDATCLCAPQHFGECAALLLRLSDQPRFTLTFPADVPFGTREDGGMLCRLHDEPILLREAFLSFTME